MGEVIAEETWSSFFTETTAVHDMPKSISKAATSLLFVERLLMDCRGGGGGAEDLLGVMLLAITKLALALASSMFSCSFNSFCIIFSLISSTPTPFCCRETTGAVKDGRDCFNSFAQATVGAIELGCEKDCFNSSAHATVGAIELECEKDCLNSSAQEIVGVIELGCDKDCSNSSAKATEGVIEQGCDTSGEPPMCLAGDESSGRVSARTKPSSDCEELEGRGGNECDSEDFSTDDALTVDAMSEVSARVRGKGSHRTVDTVR